MAITTEAGYITAKGGGKAITAQKTSIANAVAGGVFSLYRAAGAAPSQPAIPGAAAVCDSTTAGAIPLKSITGGNTLYIDEWSINGTNAGIVHVCDRLVHMGGLSGTLTTAQTVNTPALPAREDVPGVEWFLEWYADTGATAVNATVAVTLTDATTTNVVIATTATMRAGRLLPIISPAGKQIASVQTVTLSATTGAAGNFGVTAMERVGITAIIPAANLGDRAGSLILPVPATACLQFVVDASTTSTGDVRGMLRMIEG